MKITEILKEDSNLDQLIQAYNVPVTPTNTNQSAPNSVGSTTNAVGGIVRGLTNVINNAPHGIPNSYYTPPASQATTHASQATTQQATTQISQVQKYFKSKLGNNPIGPTNNASLNKILSDLGLLGK